MAKDGMAMISEVLGPPKAAPDADEAEEGGEGELETHLRAYNKAMRSGLMTEAAAAFRAAVSACQGGGDYSME
jgi:hypothetical protein